MKRTVIAAIVMIMASKTPAKNTDKSETPPWPTNAPFYGTHDGKRFAAM